MAALPLDVEPEVDPRRWTMLVFILAGNLMVVQQVASILIVVPAIRRDMEASAAGLQWVVVVYQLAFGASLVTGGRLGDVLGRRTVFLWGIGAFVLASVAAAAAPSVGVLVAARLVQGVAGGAATPQVLAMIQGSFPPQERRRAFAMFSMVGGLGYMLGQVGSGVLVRLDVLGLGWRGTFALSAAVGAVALAGALAMLREPPRPLHRRGLDLPGVVLVSLGTLLVLFPLVQGRNAGWPPGYFAAMAAAVPVLVVFWRYELRLAARGAEPLVDPTLFDIASLRIGLAVAVAHAGTSLPVLFILALVLQSGHGFDELKTSLVMLPAPFMLFTISMNGARLIRALGRRIFAVSGVFNGLGVAAMMAAFTLGPDPIGWWQLLVPITLFGVGQGTCLTSMVHLTLSDVEPERSGGASGVLQMAQQTGGAVGIAVFGTVFFGVLGGRVDADGYLDATNAALALGVVCSVALFGLHLLIPRESTFSRN